MPDVKPRPSAGAIRRSVNSADQNGVGSGRATVTEFMTDLPNGSLSVAVPAQLCTAPHVLKKRARGRARCTASGTRLGPVIARSKATKQSRIHRTTLDCFAALAMTRWALGAAKPSLAELGQRFTLQWRSQV